MYACARFRHIEVAAARRKLRVLSTEVCSASSTAAYSMIKPPVKRSELYEIADEVLAKAQLYSSGGFNTPFY